MVLRLSCSRPAAAGRAVHAAPAPRLTAATCLVAVSAASCGESPSRRPSNALFSQAFASSGSIGKCFAAQARASPRQPLPRLQALSVQTRQKLRKSCSLRREASRSASVSTGSSSSGSRARVVVLVVLLMLFGQPFSFPVHAGVPDVPPSLSCPHIGQAPHTCEGGGAPRGAPTCALWRRALGEGRSPFGAPPRRFRPRGRVSVSGICAEDRAASSSQPARSGRAQASLRSLRKLDCVCGVPGPPQCAGRIAPRPRAPSLALLQDASGGAPHGDRECCQSRRDRAAADFAD